MEFGFFSISISYEYFLDFNIIRILAQSHIQHHHNDKAEHKT